MALPLAAALTLGASGFQMGVLSALGVRGALAVGAAGLLATAVGLAFTPVVRVRTQE